MEIRNKVHEQAQNNGNSRRQEGGVSIHRKKSNQEKGKPSPRESRRHTQRRVSSHSGKCTLCDVLLPSGHVSVPNKASNRPRNYHPARAAFPPFSLISATIRLLLM